MLLKKRFVNVFRFLISIAESVCDLCSVFNISVSKYMLFFKNICCTNLPIDYDIKCLIGMDSLCTKKRME